MSDEPSRKKRLEDQSYVTIPPELRDFVPPKGGQKELLAQLANDPRLVASVAALKALNGGPDADPFFFDTRGIATPVERTEEGEAPKGAGNAKVHVPAFTAPVARSVRPAAANSVAEDADVTVERATTVGRGRAVEKVASPWATEAAAPIAASDLPSALAPVPKTEPTRATEKAPEAPPPNRWLVRVGILVVALIGLALAAFHWIPSEKMKGAAPVVPTLVPNGIASGIPPMPEVTDAGAAAPLPATTVKIDAGAAIPSAASTVRVPVKWKGGGKPVEDIYDAATPNPARTAEANVAPPAAPTVTPVAPLEKTTDPAPQSSSSSGFYLRKKPQ